MADARPKTVSLFATCLVDQFFPEVGEGAVKVLHHLGLQVEFSGAQTCCGALYPTSYTISFLDGDETARRALPSLIDRGRIIISAVREEKRGRESFPDEDARHAVDAISKCRVDLVFLVR